MLVAAAGMRMLFRTVRVEFQLAQSDADPYKPITGPTYTFCVWHDSLVMPLFVGKQPNTMAIVGQHEDGNYIAHLLRAVGLHCVRGSSSKGGAQALRQILEQGASGHFVLTPDGPRGPRREMKAGCAYLAAKSGKPVVPTAFACNRFWSVGTGWTDMVIPGLFSKVYVLTGTPIAIPANANREELAEFTRLIENEMQRVNDQAERLVAGLPGNPPDEALVTADQQADPLASE
ncbi:hypothetical protein SAMN05421753_109200 [Planctomicrobium piriforme]|uniref:DUF374 domain-containing protein n=2 Tax=Planctomicrobium piriforme TaxID=1576369 RepID=A0A1I3IP04_9PLAN|nr:hypothetical protein SAMN05421753_109200 [Planctomicrobium piriforme]